MINRLLVVDDTRVSLGSESKHTIVVTSGYLIANEVCTIRISGIDMADVESSAIRLCDVEEIFHLVKQGRVVIDILNNHIDCRI